MLHRLTWKIRKLIEKVPLLGKSILLNYAAALFLLKEQKDPRIWTDEGYMKRKLMEFIETDWETDAQLLKEEVDNMEKKSFQFLREKTVETEASTYRDRSREDEKEKKRKKSGGGITPMSQKKKRWGSGGYGKGTEEVEVDEATVLQMTDVDQWTHEIYKGLKSGWKSVAKSTLGGDENVAIMIKVTVEPEKDWPHKILHNASYGMIRIAADGTMEMFASGHKLKNMRKTKIKTPRDIIKKINTWIKSVSEEVDPHVKVMIKKGDSAKKIKAMHPEITDDELKDLGVSETVTTFKNFITEGRPALDPDYVPPSTQTDAMRAKLLSTQKRLYSARLLNGKFQPKLYFRMNR